MCCFSGRVEKVADTNIFAREAQNGRQFLVYSMKLSTKDDVAMILPVPVPKDSKDDAVRFINLEKYADFFKDMESGFPVVKADPPNRAPNAKPEDKPLPVVNVGSFEASFVPAIKDFGRLDERFRLPATVWDRLPAYKDFGFAVFKLRKGSSKVHPMAFEFPRTDARRLFFPTVHIHDGQVHAKADFDHVIYCQSDNIRALMNWRETDQPAAMFMKLDKCEGIIDPKKHCYKRGMHGKLNNEDILV